MAHVLKNHAKDLIALDFFTVPTAIFRVLFVLIVLSQGRRRGDSDPGGDTLAGFDVGQRRSISLMLPP